MPMVSFLVTTLIFLVVLSVLVLVHEFGHFIVAKWCGVRVEEFGLGLPPKAKTLFKHDGTEYTLNWLPLGGFVRLKGEQVDAEHPEEGRGKDSFAVKPIWQRIAILVAGVAMNVVMVYVLLVVGLMADARAIIASKMVGNLGERVAIVIADVQSGSSAEKGGIMKGDIILSVDGIIADQMENFPQYIRSHKDLEVVLSVERGGDIVQKNVLVGMLPDGSQPGLGVRFGLDVVSLSDNYPLPTALVKAGEGTAQTAVAIVNVLKNAIVNRDFANLAGPVGIAAETGNAARAGWIYILILTAQLSMSLAIMNVLPIPALDGGRIFLAIVEKVRGRALRPAFENVLHLIGFAALMVLILVITVRDVIRLIS